MKDEAGGDEKILAVPVDKVFAGYTHIDDIAKVSPHWLERIGHFFEHYKDLEQGKWVKLDGWGGAAEAKKILNEPIERCAALLGQQNFCFASGRHPPAATVFSARLKPPSPRHPPSPNASTTGHH